MARSAAETVPEYLDSLPDDVRERLQPVLALVRATVPPGLAEGMDFGMITWSVPLAVYPDTYNKRPLMYCALAAQKRHIALYVVGTDAAGCGRIDEAVLRQRWSGGRPLDMGRSCVRFREPADLDLPLLGEVLGQWTVAAFVDHAKAARSGRGTGS